jgi:hypothetical protein
MKKLAFAFACFVVLTVGATGAWANAIQVTLSSSSSGGVMFTNNAGTLGFSFTGTSGQCGHANCISGNLLLEPQALVGKYTMWMTGSPTLTGGPSDYVVNMNGGAVWLSLILIGYPDTFTGQLNLTDVFAGTSMTPLFDGTFSTTSSSGVYLGSGFPSGITGIVDFTTRITGGVSIATLGSNQQVPAVISSGELVPSPEPSSLALLGTGILGLAGAVRKKLKS